jgi:hypothetical protein
MRMANEWLHPSDSFCSKCGAVLTNFSEGFRETCVDCLPNMADEDDDQAGGFMGPSGLQKEYWD